MCRQRWLCGGILMLLTLTVSAQDLRTQVEQLRTDMYRLFGTDSLQRFMETSDRLKEMAQKTGDEKTFYRTWGNQVLFIFRKKRPQGGSGHAGTVARSCLSARQQVWLILRHIG